MLARFLLVLLCAGGLVVQATHVQRRARKPTIDVYGSYLRRFEEVRTALAREPRAGYLGDGPRVQGFPDDEATGLLFAQYALLPTVLAAADEGCRWLVVNWHGAAAPAPIPPGYERALASASGVELWRRR